MRLLLGAALVLSCGLVGIGKAREEKSRIAALGDLASGIEMMKSEVCCRRATMPSVARELSTCAAGRAGELFAALDGLMPRLGAERLENLWGAAVESLHLRREERTALLRLGAVLGRYDAEEQGREMEKCISRLRDIERACALKAEQTARLYTALGFCAGAMAAAILL